MTEIILQCVEPDEFVLKTYGYFHLNTVFKSGCRFKLTMMSGVIDCILYVENEAPQICIENNTSKSNLDILSWSIV